ncbi:hypothetical protein Tco_0231482 [Tanacetum coccineum]
MNWGEVNPSHAYYNGSRLSKVTEDPSWSTGIKTGGKTRVIFSTGSTFKDFILFVVYLLEHYLVMSDLDESGVTYTEVFSLFEGLSDIGSPRADDHEYLELLDARKYFYVKEAL